MAVLSEARRRSILSRARSAGYTGPDNTGNVNAWASSIASGNTSGASASQRRSARSLANATNNSV